MKQKYWLGVFTGIVFTIILVIISIIAMPLGYTTRAQVETAAVAKPEKVEYQEVTIVTDIAPANLVTEIHRLNEQGKVVRKDDVIVGSDGKMIIWLMDSPGEDE